MKTNRERINAMSNEELADYFYDFLRSDWFYCVYQDAHDKNASSKNFAQWLNDEQLQNKHRGVYYEIAKSNSKYYYSIFEYTPIMHQRHLIMFETSYGDQPKYTENDMKNKINDLLINSLNYFKKD